MTFLGFPWGLIELVLIYRLYAYVRDKVNVCGGMQKGKDIKGS